MEQVIEAVRGFLSEKLRIPDAQAIAADLPLLQKGVIDSLELLQVASFLEKTFDIPVEDTDVVPSNFRSLATMAAFVERKRAGR
jgi:acyl carrier protein